MFYEPFNERFPEIAERETRCLLVFNDPELPADEYALIEAYCTEPGCDCRRVFFLVWASNREEMVAVITYGWERMKFYKKWLGGDDADLLHELKGPALNMISRQTELSHILLERVKVVLKDSNYVDRLKRHYAMFKQAIDSEKNEEAEAEIKEYSARIPRNAACPCGSGLKYKKCCGADRLH